MCKCEKKDELGRVGGAALMKIADRIICDITVQLLIKTNLLYSRFITNLI